MSTNQKRKLDTVETEINYGNKRQNRDESDEENIAILVNEVLIQGPLGKLVVIQDESENPYVTLQNSVSYLNMDLSVVRDTSNHENFELQINGTGYAKGTFRNMQLAKKALAEEALGKLKETCFFIYKKKNYVNVTKKDLEASPSGSQMQPQQPINNDSIAHKIMMKMGWTGGGLGAQEQGDIDTLILCENINRLGLGTNNLTGEITKRLIEFSKSCKVLTLVFDDDFTKEERMLIHKLARKYNLKSKSTGKESRKLTVSKKITRIDIVKELLKIGGEDGLYKLHIPTRFTHLW